MEPGAESIFPPAVNAVFIPISFFLSYLLWAVFAVAVHRMLVTDAGQLIRCPVNDVRVAGRNTQGVTLFRTAEGESVVSVEHLGDVGADDDGEESDGESSA